MTTLTTDQRAHVVTDGAIFSTTAETFRRILTAMIAHGGVRADIGEQVQHLIPDLDTVPATDLVVFAGYHVWVQIMNTVADEEGI